MIRSELREIRAAFRACYGNKREWPLRIPVVTLPQKKGKTTPFSLSLFDVETAIETWLTTVWEMQCTIHEDSLERIMYRGNFGYLFDVVGDHWMIVEVPIAESKAEQVQLHTGALVLDVNAISLLPMSENVCPIMMCTMPVQGLKGKAEDGTNLARRRDLTKKQVNNYNLNE